MTGQSAKMQNMIVTFFGLGLLTLEPQPAWSHIKDYEDLSYTFSEDTIYFPRQRPFSLSKDHVYGGPDDPSQAWYAAYSFCMGEHGGTHIDAPIHFFQQGWSVEQIPADRLIEVPGAVINVEEKVNSYPRFGEYQLTVQDILEHEAEYGQVPTGGLVLVHTGWGKYWGNKTLFLGTDSQAEGAAASLRFPGVSEEAARWLYNERAVVGIGLDTSSIDAGHTGVFPVHRFLASKQMYILENVAHMHLITKRRMGLRVQAQPAAHECTRERDSCESSGNSGSRITAHAHKKMCASFTFFVLPLKIVSGTGSPARILVRCDN